jgi:CRISPR/Cas system-associated exonuclease Cas4 (RecB family)
LCTDIVKDRSVILLNPSFGGELDDIEKSIPSDADLVTDDILIDIKCTKNQHPVSEITQLLGYSALILLNKNYRIKINKISIINILLGHITTYNIDFVNKENCIKYIQLLTNS